MRGGGGEDKKRQEKEMDGGGGRVGSTLKDEVLIGEGAGLVKTAHVHLTSKRNTERLL